MGRCPKETTHKEDNGRDEGDDVDPFLKTELAKGQSHGIEHKIKTEIMNENQ